MVKLSTTIGWLAFAPVLGRELKSVVSSEATEEYESLDALMTIGETPVVAVAIQCPSSRGYLVYLLTKKWSVNQHNNLMDKSDDDLKDALFPNGEYKWADWTEHNKISIAGSSASKDRKILGVGDTGYDLKLEVEKNTGLYTFKGTVQTLNFTAFDNLGSKKLTVSAYTLHLETCPTGLKEKVSSITVEIAPIDGTLQDPVVTEESALFSADESWGPVEYILISVFVGVPLCCCLLFVVCKAISKKKDQDRSRKEQQEAEQNSSPRLQRPRVNRPHAGNRQ